MSPEGTAERWPFGAPQPSLRDLSFSNTYPNAEALGYSREVPPGQNLGSFRHKFRFRNPSGIGRGRLRYFVTGPVAAGQRADICVQQQQNFPYYRPEQMAA
jgi:hypothetical protein